MGWGLELEPMTFRGHIAIQSQDPKLPVWGLFPTHLLVRARKYLLMTSSFPLNEERHNSCKENGNYWGMGQGRNI